MCCGGQGAATLPPAPNVPTLPPTFDLSPRPSDQFSAAVVVPAPDATDWWWLWALAAIMVLTSR